MWDSTLDFIAQAASSSLFIFCFCNLIVGIILFIGSKRSIDMGQELGIPLSTVAIMHTHDMNVTRGRGVRVVEESEAFTVPEEASKVMETKVVADDELRRRVEEFIDKVNKGWKAESMMMSGFYTVKQGQNIQVGLSTS